MQKLSGCEINSRSLYGIWGGISSLFAEKLAMSWQNSNLFPPRTYIWPTCDHLWPSENAGLFAFHCGLVGRCQCEVCHLIPAKVGKPRLMGPNRKSTNWHIQRPNKTSEKAEKCWNTAWWLQWSWCWKTACSNSMYVSPGSWCSACHLSSLAAFHLDETRYGRHQKRNKETSKIQLEDSCN